MAVDDGGTIQRIDQKELHEQLVGIKSKNGDIKKTVNISWFPYILSVFVYFLSKIISETINIPIDMYVFILIIAGLLTYSNYIQNK